MEDLSELLIQKEKELQKISKMRLLQLEEQVKSKSQAIEDLTQKLQNIQEDFNYNVKLIDDRDAELLDLEQKFDSLRKLVKNKDAEISELRAYLATAEQKLKNENNKTRTQEILLIESRDLLREELAEIKWKKEDETRTLKKMIEENEKNYEKMLRQKEEENQCFKTLVTQKCEKIAEGIEERLEGEKNVLMNEILEKDQKIQNLINSRNSLQEQLEKFRAENKAEELEKFYTAEIRNYEESLSEKDLQVNKLIDHSKHLAQQLDLLKAQLESESEYSQAQKTFYEKELAKFKNSHQEEKNFLKESYEIQIQRLNSTYTSQITRLQERLNQTEEESEKAYIQSHQLREKSLQNEKKTSSEIEKIEEIYKKDLQNNAETIRILRFEISAKDSELRSLQENLGCWKNRSEQGVEENNRLRIGLQEREIQVQTLKNEINLLKEEKNIDKDGAIRKIREDYERKIQELTEDLDSARNKAKINNEAIKLFKKTDDFPKLWSEDYGPASSVRSQESSNKNLLRENEELKNIIEQMRKDMEMISEKMLYSGEDSEKLKQLALKLKKITAERDQLLEISSELRAELRMHNKSPQYQEKDLIGQLTHVQEGFSPRKTIEKILPDYKDFEEIMNEVPEKEKVDSRKPFPVVNSGRETASQKEIHEKYRSNLKKTKKPIGRNYNIKE